MPSDTEVETLLARVAEAARREHDHAEAAKAERERRNDAIVDAMDAGLSADRVAEAAQLSRTRVFRILAGSDQ